MARFSQFCLSHDIDVPENIGGDIHSNSRIHFWRTDLVLPGNVTSASNFFFHDNPLNNINVLQMLQDHVEYIGFPDLSYVYGLATAPYLINTNNGYAEIKLKKDSVEIKINGGNKNNYPLPANGVILVDGDTYIKGKLNGRLTVFCVGNIKITCNLQYVDSNDKTAYKHGTMHDEAYIPNPDYTGESCLGLVALNNIEIASDAPNSIEINALTFSLLGHVGIAGYDLHAITGALIAYNPDFEKNSIRHLGSIISNQKSVYGIYFFSSLVSGFANRKLVYDDKAGLRPPPYFPALQRPKFNGWEVIR